MSWHEEDDHVIKDKRKAESRCLLEPEKAHATCECVIVAIHCFVWPLALSGKQAGRQTKILVWRFGFSNNIQPYVKVFLFFLAMDLMLDSL